MVELKSFPNVKFVKFPEIDEVDLGLIEKSLASFFKKVGDDAKLTLALKEYKKGGLRSQHEIHGTLLVNGKSYFADFEDWQLLEVLQHILKVLEKEYLKKASKEKE
ncbi:MAG: hypothetical protein WCW44_02420 [archaeon]|jgi:hypothetical protein